MKPLGILYATREGHTERIAGHLASFLSTRGLAIEVRNVRYDASAIQLDNFAAVILAASVHFGKHEPEMSDSSKITSANCDVRRRPFCQ
jgi:menaquinone-dependent protoporphyrinogen oxidase